MSVTVEISNVENLRRLRDIFSAKTDSEAVEISIQESIRAHEPEVREIKDGGDLPDEYWEDLFSEPPIPSSVIDRALREERS